MIGLLQRVTEARVAIGGKTVAEINGGLLVLVAVERSDTEHTAKRLLERLLNYRVFADVSGRMNLGLTEVGGSLLLVPQFTLAAETGNGLRPSFTSAAPPAQAEKLYNCLVDTARAQYGKTGSGIFGADMQVSLVNDGPVTFYLKVG